MSDVPRSASRNLTSRVRASVAGLTRRKCARKWSTTCAVVVELVLPHNRAEIDLGRRAGNWLHAFDRHLPATIAGVAGVEIFVAIGRHVGLGDNDAFSLAGGRGDVGAVTDAL